MQAQGLEAFAKAFHLIISLLSPFGEFQRGIVKHFVEEFDQFARIVGNGCHLVALIGNHLVDFDNAGAGLGRDGIKVGNILFVFFADFADFGNRLINTTSQIVRTLIQREINLFNTLNRVFRGFGNILTDSQQLVAQHIKFIRQFGSNVKMLSVLSLNLLLISPIFCATSEETSANILYCCAMEASPRRAWVETTFTMSDKLSFGDSAYR